MNWVIDENEPTMAEIIAMIKDVRRSHIIDNESIITYSPKV